MNQFVQMVNGIIQMNNGMLHMWLINELKLLLGKIHVTEHLYIIIILVVYILLL